MSPRPPAPPAGSDPTDPIDPADLIDPTRETRATGSGPVRRAVLLGAGGALASGCLAACSVYGGSNADSGGDAGGDDAAAADAGGAGQTLGPVSEVPVGGGTVFADQKVVVTQPSEGVFQGFSAICTHQGCTVNEVADGTINCPCHGSKFAVADGSVAGGPAPSPLESRAVTVEGDSIVLS